MAESSIDCSDMSDYVGLEILIKLHLNQLAYKSDLIILLTHYILTKVLDYDCVEIVKNDDKELYNIVEVLPISWNQLPDRYNLTYKKDDTVKIVSGRKSNDSFMLHVLKKNYDREQISGQIELKYFISDEFFDANHKWYKNLRWFKNVWNIMDILETTILGNSKLKSKKLLDEDEKENISEVGEVLRAMDETPSLQPPTRYPEDEEVNYGEFRLQHPDRHKPVDVNRDVDFNLYNNPDYYLQEDIEGEPTSSIYS